MIRRISHVGVVVNDLEGTLKLLEKLFKLKPSAVVNAQEGKVRAAFVPVGDGEIELLQPIEPDVPLMSFLQKHGPGIHHISITTDDVESEVERLRKEGVLFDREKPTVGAHGTKIIFTAPQSTCSIPLELMEDHKPKVSA